MNPVLVGLVALGGVLFALSRKAHAATVVDDSRALPDGKPSKDKPKKKKAAKPKPDAKEPTKLDTEKVVLVADAAKKGEVEPSDAQRRDAAEQLYKYVVGLYDHGEAEKLTGFDRNVQTAQRVMGGLKDDGRYGEKTRARGKALYGKEFPSRKGIALELLAYVQKALAGNPPQFRIDADLGTPAEPNEVIAKAQRMMGGLDADGAYGDKTQARGATLAGKPFPKRPARAKAPPSPPEPKPEAKAAEPPKPKPKASEPAPKPKPQPKPKRKAKAKSKPAPKPAEPAKRSPEQAAKDLLAHVQANPNARGYGTKSEPNETVRAAQADMGNLTTDGQYGPKTRARGAELGVKLPPRK